MCRGGWDQLRAIPSRSLQFNFSRIADEEINSGLGLMESFLSKPRKNANKPSLPAKSQWMKMGRMDSGEVLRHFIL